MGGLTAVFGAIVTLTIFCATCIFHLGRLTARVDSLEKSPPLRDRLEALETWRLTMRQDMREISDILEGVGQELKRLSTIIEERTDRRNSQRD